MMAAAISITPQNTLLGSRSPGRQTFGKLEGQVRPQPRKIRLFDANAFLSQAGVGRTIVDLKRGQIGFSQGDPAEAVFYIQRGTVRLSVLSSRGKEAIIAVLTAGDFLGEECIV